MESEETTSGIWSFCQQCYDQIQKKAHQEKILLYKRQIKIYLLLGNDAIRSVTTGKQTLYISCFEGCTRARSRVYHAFARATRSSKSGIAFAVWCSRCGSFFGYWRVILRANEKVILVFVRRRARVYLNRCEIRPLNASSLQRTQLPNTSATLVASSWLNCTSVPFSA